MRKSLFIGLVAILGLIGCSRNQEIDIPDANLSLFARTESPAESRTVVESGVHVYWEPGDEIAVFMGEQSAKFTTDITAASGTATFKGTFGDQGWPEKLDLWAIYPFSEEAVFDGETITTTLPSEQVAREGSFGKDMNLAIAHSNSSTLQFYNVGGGIRFSVLEEGIKKVMFEGLSGEIISGKVKIGLDESGKPEVKEVTGGSQFLTLLPPSGKETFEPGAWYYIVAIPGTLDGGYKLRFYKDSDYARKVSEKAVQIKRSIFGNIEKADEGIEYEPQATHFPETKEDWITSVNLTNQINDRINSLLTLSLDHTQPINQDVINAIQDIEGVLELSVASDTASISFMQRDSVWCNYLLSTQNAYDYDSTLSENNASRYVLSKSRTNKTLRNNVQSGTAFIYVPFQWSFNKPVDTWISDLAERLGRDNITVRGKRSDYDDGGVFVLKEELSKHYDLIIIDTHGMVGHTEKHPRSKPKQTMLATSTKYTDEIIEQLHKEGITDNQFGNAYSDGVSYVCIAPDFLGNNRFDHSAVILSACKSAKKTDYTDEDDNGTMIGAFINRHAAIVTGSKVSMRTSALKILVSKMIEFLKNGFSFQNAFDYLTPKNGRIDIWLHYLWEYLQSQNIWDDIFLAFRGYNIPDNYIIECNPNYQEPFFIFDVAPVLNKPDPKENPISFSWECTLNDFNIKWPTEISSEGDIIEGEATTYSIHYDIYVDDSRLGKTLYTDDTDKKALWIPSSTGWHKWYIVANIKEGDTILASYQSPEDEFYVPEEQRYETPETKDLGLSVKWASFNLGATKPEMPGYYFAWGETEPYYSNISPLIWKDGKDDGYDWASYKWCNGSSSSITKYNTEAVTQLEPEDDAAHVNLGDKWRIPTEDEWAELRNNCSFIWTTQEGVNGLLVTSLKPGYTNVSIFLPAAGAVGNTSQYYLGEAGFYWTSGNNTTNKENAGYNTFETGSSGLSYGWIDRCYGLSIRPVYGDQVPPTTGDIEGTEEDPWN